MSIRVATRSLGSRRPLLDDFSVDPPPALGDGGDVTLRDLITAVTRSQVRLFNGRRAARRFDRVLTDRQVSEGVKQGKVDPEGRPRGPEADAEEAVAAALLAFEDGMYLVVVDEIERRDLDEVIRLRAESTMVFLRLAFLAGA